MKNNTNIYDFDGELIRAAGDNHKMTIEEAQERIKYYQDELNSDEYTEFSDQKITAYRTYIRNLQNYILNEYAKMDKNKLSELLKKEIEKKDLNTQVKEAIDQLKKEVRAEDEIPEGNPDNIEDNTNKESGDDTPIERTDSDVHEEGSTTKGDLLVERDSVTPIMDEYVDFEEV